MRGRIIKVFPFVASTGERVPPTPPRRNRVGLTVESTCYGLLSGCRKGSDELDGLIPERPRVRIPTDTPTPTPTDTPTPTPTDTPTPTPTPTGPPRHDLGEWFVVGEGSNAFAYTAHQFLQADRLGQFGGYPAEGVYVVADMTVEKLSGDGRPVPVESLIVRGGVIRKPDVEMSNNAAKDDRIDSQSLANVVAFPGQKIRGILVYDVPRDSSNDYYLRLTPPNTSSDDAAHAVTIGPYDELPPVE